MRCEGWTRTGGVFTFGPVTWKQCESDATVMLSVNQDGKQTTQPACEACHEKAKRLGIQILKTEPIASDTCQPGEHDYANTHCAKCGELVSPRNVPM